MRAQVVIILVFFLTGCAGYDIKNLAKSDVDMVADDFIVLSGEDAQTLRMLELGAVGTISVTANVLPEMMAGFCNAYLGGDVARAQALDEELQSIHEILFVEPSPTPTKWALYEMKRIDRGIRLPLIELTEPTKVELNKRLKAVGALSA